MILHKSTVGQTYTICVEYRDRTMTIETLKQRTRTQGLVEPPRLEPYRKKVRAKVQHYQFPLKMRVEKNRQWMYQIKKWNRKKESDSRQEKD